ncbi:MAG: hypothetical protein ABSE45_14960 [Candidatus Acidiferrales bacterium]
MSAKKHILVPRGFTAADLTPPLLHSEKFHRMTRQEASALARAGRIRALGDSGKIWQLTDDSLARPSWESGGGRISLEVPVSVQALMAAEMRRPRAWCVT